MPADATPGQTVELGNGHRRHLLYVPTDGYDGERQLLVSLHGAGAGARAGLDRFMSSADAAGLVLLAPSSEGRTWDAVGGAYGHDVETIEQLVADAVARTGVSLAGAAVAGFSDGASYALGLGLANGDLFDAVVAFSPGFVPPAPSVGDPRVFVSHGNADDVLPVDQTSRRIVERLRDDGYDVTYREFDGGHEVPPRILEAAVDWLEAVER